MEGFLRFKVLAHLERVFEGTCKNSVSLVAKGLQPCNEVDHRHFVSTHLLKDSEEEPSVARKLKEPSVSTASQHSAQPKLGAIEQSEL